MEETRVSRRHMLAMMGGAVGAAAIGWGIRPWQALGSAIVPFATVPVAVGGEDNRVGHMLRDGHVFKIPQPSRRCDVVVVGAGISGLTAAYVLKSSDVLVLEKEDRPGGHARKGDWKGVTYSEGAAYVSDVSGYVGTLIDELRIPLVAIREPSDAYYVGGRFATGYWGAGASELPLDEGARRGFQQFMTDLRSLKDLPPLPVESASAAALAYDSNSFAQLLKPYGPELLRYMDLYCRSALGGPVTEVSAYWGLNFLGGEYGVRYSAPGGNAVYGESLMRAVGPERILTKATVIRVENKGDRVWTTYVLGHEPVTVESRAVVMAAPKQLARHVVVDLPPAQQAAMGQMRYEPYLVANVLVEGAVPRPAYDTWGGDGPFTDVVVADWTAPTPDQRHGVLTAYCPLPYADRHTLLDDQVVKTIARGVVASLDRMHPGLGRHVVGVRAYRRGHPMVLSAVNGLTALRPLTTQPHGNIFFAHSDSQLAATIEAAVWEGQKSGLQAMKATLSVQATAGGRVLA
jgi:monoamine oxidase